MAETSLATRQNGALAQATAIDNTTLTALITDGDCSRLNEDQKRSYYLARCEAAGLDPRTAPLMFTKLNGKLVLYALKGASDQLASIHGVVTLITSKETTEGVHVVTVRATARDGRSTEDVGAVTIAGKKNDDLANALMKAVTKAKRRAILSLCGLGMADETELETIAVRAPPRSPPAAGIQVIDTTPAETEPPHDPETGEVIEEEDSALAALRAMSPPEQAGWLKSHFALGFNGGLHKTNAHKRYGTIANALPLELRKEVKLAFDKAPIRESK